jgi:hypothetical protein
VQSQTAAPDPDMHSIAPSTCPICGSERWQPMLDGVHDYITPEQFDVVRCAECGLGVTTPMPGDEVIERYYSARYHGDRHAFTDRFEANMPVFRTRPDRDSPLVADRVTRVHE